MQNEVKENRGIGQKILIALLVFLLAGSVWYNYKQKEEIKTVKTAEDKMVAEKAVMEAEIKKRIADYDEAINQKSAITAELTAEKAINVKLLADIKKTKGDVSALLPFKQKYKGLEEKYKQLMAQNEELKKQNITLTTQRDSTVAVLGEAKKYNDELVSQNNELTTKVVKAAKLSVVAVKTSAYKIKGSGKIIDTDKASATDMLRTAFTVVENAAAKPGERVYYIQIIDANNNVLGDKKTETFGTKSLTYSFKSIVKYNNKTINVTQEMLGKDFAKGVYFVNIFDKGEMIADSSFSLK